MRIKLPCTLLYIAFIGFLSVDAQTNYMNSNARSNALGGAFTTLVGYAAVNGNQAGIAKEINPSVIVYNEKSFWISELNTVAVGFILPTKSGVFALSTSYKGFSTYANQNLGLVYGRSLSKNLSVGLKMNYQSIGIKEYGAVNSFQFQMGMQSKLSDELSIGIHIYNPVGFFVNQNEVLNQPVIFNIGLAYKPSKGLSLVSEIEKNIDFKTNVKGGIEYLINKKLFIRGGIATAPISSSIGFGLILNRFKFDFATQIHTVLGITTSVQLNYLINNKY